MCGEEGTLESVAFILAAQIIIFPTLHSVLVMYYEDRADSTKRGEEDHANLNAFYSRLLIHL